MNISNLSIQIFKSVYSKFAMVYDYKEIQFADLIVHVENGFLKTKFFSNSTDKHQYLDVQLFH